ncbi:leucine-rich repeat [Anaeramoeba flamelloides]|uniref:Leucine-rich repeat n=1 Tax=Anaeramoeba flamelloides TaxID=1746091 RepID=A0ABQ8XZC4_9EUKA|nr:leucine-rich repeat [Anaeramoeba flamelloides]
METQHSYYKKLLKEEVHLIMNFKSSEKLHTFLLTHSSVYLVTHKKPKKRPFSPKSKKKRSFSDHGLTKVENAPLLTLKELSGNGHHLFDLKTIESLTRFTLILKFPSTSTNLMIETNQSEHIIEKLYTQIRKITIGSPSDQEVRFVLAPPKRKQRLEKIINRIKKKREIRPGHGYEDCYKACCTKNGLSYDEKFLQNLRRILRVSRRITFNQISLSNHATATSLQGKKEEKYGAGSGSGDLDNEDGGLSMPLIGITRDRCFSFDQELIRHINSNKNYNLSAIFQALKHNTWFYGLALHDFKKKEMLPLICKLLSENKTISALILSGIGLSGDSLSELAAKILDNPSSRINSIDVSNNPNVNERSVVSFIEKMSQRRKRPIRHLSLRGLSMTKSLPTLLIDDFTNSINLSNLTTLDLSGNKLGKSGTAAFVEFYKGMLNAGNTKAKGKGTRSGSMDHFNKESENDHFKKRKLGTLILADTNIIATPLLQEICRNGFHSLKHLDLSGNKLCQDDCELLGKLIEKSFILRILRLSRCNIAVRPSLETLTNSLKIAKKISHFTLDLSGNNLGQEGANLLALSLYNSNILESLIVANCGFNNRAASLIVASFLNNPYLRILNLANNIKGNEDASLTCLELSYLLQKKQLRLKHLDISSDGKNYLIKGNYLKTVFEALHENKNLKSLDVSGNNFQNDELNLFFDFLTKNESLNRLKCNNNNFTINEIDKFYKSIEKNTSLFSLPELIPNLEKLLKKKKHNDQKKLINSMKKKLIQNRNTFERTQANENARKLKLLESMGKKILNRSSGGGGDSNSNRNNGQIEKQQKIKNLLYLKNRMSVTRSHFSTVKTTAFNLNNQNFINNGYNAQNQQSKFPSDKRLSVVNLSSTLRRASQRKRQSQRNLSRFSQKLGTLQYKQDNSNEMNKFLSIIEEKTKKKLFLFPESNNDNKKNDKGNKNKEEVEKEDEEEELIKLELEKRKQIMSAQTIEMNDDLLKLIKKRDFQIIKKLFQKGKLKINMIDPKDNSTLIHYVCHWGNPEILSYLLRRDGAQEFVNLKDTYGKSPLHYLMEKGNSLDCVQLLSDFEIEWDVVDSTGMNPLQTLIYSYVGKGIDHSNNNRNNNNSQNQNTTKNEILNGNKQINDQNNNYKTMIQLFEYLIQRGSNYNSMDFKGNTVLHVASSKGLYRIVAILCNLENLLINITDSKGKTAILKASRNGYHEIVKHLIKFGADPNILDNNRQSALDLARIYEQTKCINILEKYYETQSELIQESNELIELESEKEKEKLNKINNRNNNNNKNNQYINNDNNKNKQKLNSRVDIKIPFKIKGIVENFSEARTFKVCILGPHRSGKTKLLDRLIFRNYFSQYVQGLENQYKKFIIIEGKEMLLNITDVSGEDIYEIFLEKWIKDSDGFILNYSIDQDIKWFNQIENFYLKKISQIKNKKIHQIPFIILSNKNDLINEKEHSKNSKILNDQGKKLANKYNRVFIETSAKNNMNINQTFVEIIKIMYNLENRENLIHKETKLQQEKEKRESKFKLKKREERKIKREKQKRLSQKRSKQLNYFRQQQRQLQQKQQSKGRGVKEKVERGQEKEREKEREKEKEKEREREKNMKKNMKKKNEKKNPKTQKKSKGKFSRVFKKKKPKPVNLDFNNNDEELLFTFNEILEDEVLFAIFEQYLKDQYAEENLLFYKEVNKLKKIDPEENGLIVLCAKQIFKDYVSNVSEFEINIEGHIRKEIYQDVQQNNFSLDMFDKALKSVIAILSTDSYYGFMESPYIERIYQLL